MSSTSFTVVRDDFHRDLNRVEELLRLIQSFRDFGTSKPPLEVANRSIVWSEALTLSQAAPKVRTDLPLLSGSLLLYTFGRFEYFIRELIIALADDMASRAQLYSDLPSRLRKELETKTLEVAQNPRRFGYENAEAHQFLSTHVNNLAESGTASRTVIIESRVLTVTEANMHPGMLAELFKRVDIIDVWSEVGKQASLKSMLGSTTDKDCTAAAKKTLEELMRDRNSVAHPTGSVSFPDLDQVLNNASFLRVLSVILVDIAQVPRPLTAEVRTRPT